MPNNQFKDQEGRQWIVRITNRTVRDIKQKLGLDLRELLNEECRPLLGLISDSLRLAQVLFIACDEQAKAAGITEDAFLDAFYGDVVDTAGDAFSVAFVDFFPNPQIRAAITEMLGLSRKLRSEIATAASEKVAAAIASTDTSSIANSIVSRGSSE